MTNRELSGPDDDEKMITVERETADGVKNCRTVERIAESNSRSHSSRVPVYRAGESASKKENKAINNQSMDTIFIELIFDQSLKLLPSLY